VYRAVQPAGSIASRAILGGLHHSMFGFRFFGTDKGPIVKARDVARCLVAFNHDRVAGDDIGLPIFQIFRLPNSMRGIARWEMTFVKSEDSPRFTSLFSSLIHPGIFINCIAAKLINRPTD
jgi:hypothetical protein